MSRISKQVRAYVDDPESTGRLHYGEWGILRSDQRRLIRQLCDECDAFERDADKFYRKASEGEWVDRYKGQFANPIYVCSVCGKGTLLTPYINELGQMEMVQAFSHFCPNCGAKMKHESKGADDGLE